MEVSAIAKAYGFSLDVPVQDLPQDICSTKNKFKLENPGLLVWASLYLAIAND